MLSPSTSLADVTHRGNQIAPALVTRLRAAGVATAKHLLTMTESTAALFGFTDDDRIELRRWRGRLRKQLTPQQGI